MLLTRNNWNDLSDAGFPPTTSVTTQQQSVLVDDRDAIVDDDNSTTSDTFMRIGSLNLLGNVKLRIWSKPLNQSISPEWIRNIKYSHKTASSSVVNGSAFGMLPFSFSFK